VLVTGGAGFIGSHLVDALLARGDAVTALDDLSTGRRENVPAAAKLVVADLRDRAAVARAVEGHDLVFHFGANADVPTSVRDPDLDFGSNAVGTHHVLRACIEHRTPRVVFASSAAVYGNPLRLPIDEDHPLRPVSPYGASKLAGEQLGLVYHGVYGLPFTAVRIFNVYGERSRRYVIHDLLRKLGQDARHLEILGDGAQRRDFCHVEDAVAILLRVADRGALAGRTINLCAGSPLTIRALAEEIVAGLGLEGVTKMTFSGASWQGDINVLLGDPSRMVSEIGYAPRVTLREGIARVAAWLTRVDGWRPAL
jgi:UDP-glucose 4-epimerase